MKQMSCKKNKIKIKKNNNIYIYTIPTNAPLILIMILKVPVKTEDVIVYVPASLDCSCPLETRFPKGLTINLEEKDGDSW